jgi:hypothetical protein
MVSCNCGDALGMIQSTKGPIIREVFEEENSSVENREMSRAQRMTGNQDLRNERIDQLGRSPKEYRLNAVTVPGIQEFRLQKGENGLKAPPSGQI